MLMNVLGWIALGASFTLGLYLWYMSFCFFAQLRKAGEDTRRVLRAISALPLSRHFCRDARDSAEAPSCAICLSEFEEGELVRALPCGHEFRKHCIDLWIRKQGLSASCPLCKRLLVPADDDEENLGTEPLMAPRVQQAAEDADEPMSLDEAMSLDEPMTHVRPAALPEMSPDDSPVAEATRVSENHSCGPCESEVAAL